MADPSVFDVVVTVVVAGIVAVALIVAVVWLQLLLVRRVLAMVDGILDTVFTRAREFVYPATLDADPNNSPDTVDPADFEYGEPGTITDPTDWTVPDPLTRPTVVQIRPGESLIPGGGSGGGTGGDHGA